MTQAEINRYWDYIRTLPCAHCGAHGVQLSHYIGVSGDNLGRGLSSKSHPLAVVPHCSVNANRCHEQAEARTLWAMDGADRFTNKLSHSEGFLVQIMETQIKAVRDGALKLA